MTFAEFQATRRHSDNIGDELSFDDGGVTAVGNIYVDHLYIDSTDNWEEAYRTKKWHLIIGRVEYLSDDLAELEHRLYLFAVSEDYDDAQKTLVEDALNAAVKTIQDRLGVKTGDVAGAFFSGPDKAGDIRAILANYIATETDANG